MQARRTPFFTFKIRERVKLEFNQLIITLRAVIFLRLDNKSFKYQAKREKSLSRRLDEALYFRSVFFFSVFR